MTSGKNTSLHSQTKERGQRFGNVAVAADPIYFQKALISPCPHASETVLASALYLLMSPLTPGFCCRVKEITAFIAQALTDRIIYSIAVVSRRIQELEGFYILLILVGV